MNKTKEAINKIIGKDGILDNTIPNYEVRKAQLDIAYNVLDAVTNRKTVLIEAGTGIGKTMAYLVAAAMSGKKVVISTATKNLQDQIYYNEVPLLVNKTCLDIPVLLLKGRSSYLCIKKLRELDLDISLDNVVYGERSEFPDIKEWDKVTVNIDDCERCPHTEICYLESVKRIAKQSRLLITNHSLTIIDSILKTQGKGILPDYDLVIFDEAHKLEDAAIKCFSTTKKMDDIIDVIKEEMITENKHHKQHVNDIMSELKRDKEILQNVVVAFQQMREDNNTLVWSEEENKEIVIKTASTDIGDKLEYVLNRKGVVFISGTLTVDDSFDYIKNIYNITHNEEYKYQTEFDTGKSMMIFQRDLPSPTEKEFIPAAAERIIDIIVKAKGRSLVLFNSYASLNQTYDIVKDRIDYLLLRQGDNTRVSLLSNFKRSIDSVLFATGSFWEGVDVPGEALSCVVIHRLPFPHPNDPIVKLKESKGNSFGKYCLPKAVMLLHQGVGRLLRNKNDIGVVVVMDKRIIDDKYNKIFLNGLPPMQASLNIEDINTVL